MITLHHLEKSRSMRIIWALEELELDYQIKLYKRLPNYAAPAELKQVHPLGKAPVISDADLNIAESAVILDYLQSHYDHSQQFKPNTAEDSLQYQYWMHYAEGSLMPLLVMSLVLSFVPAKVPFIIRPLANKIVDGVKDGFIQPRLAEHIEFIENHLAKNQFFAADFSFADIQMSFPLIAIDERMKGKYPQIRSFVQRIQQRDAYRRAAAKNNSQ